MKMRSSDDCQAEEGYHWGVIDLSHISTRFDVAPFCRCSGWVYRSVEEEVSTFLDKTRVFAGAKLVPE